MNLKGHIKTIRQTSAGFIINNKVFIDNNGVLYNAFMTLTPYKNFPRYYFTLRDQLLEVTK